MRGKAPLPGDDLAGDAPVLPRHAAFDGLHGETIRQL
jgi:hypothetical protein